MRPRHAAAVLSALLASASPAAAHAPFLAPESFTVSRDWVTVTAGMHEETPLTPDFALRAPGDLEETGPDGRTVKVEGVVQLKGLTAADVPLPAPGLYRISTGARVARQATWAQVAGVWRPIRPARPGAEGAAGGPAGGVHAAPAGHREAGEGPAPLEAAPPGAPTAQTTAYLRADTYVVRGASTKAVPRPDGRGLEFAPGADPSAVYLDAGLPLTLLLNGRPVPGAAVLVRRADGPYAERKVNFGATTDAEGRVRITFPIAGAYVIEAQTAPSPPGARPPARTYLSTLTLEATP
ncbi:MAG: DUF4198 domain-containing protein [Caulobacteraceae bacterium]|nr:DUF4198 domain-containing protein [Caulobacter sp.]